MQVWAFAAGPLYAAEADAAALALAASLSGEAVSVAVGDENDLRGRAGGRVLLKGPSQLDSETRSEALARAWKMRQPAAVVVPATREGREVAAMLSAKVGVGCVSDVSTLTSDGTSLTAERSAFAGKVVARLRTALPCVVTIKPGSFAPAAGSEGATDLFEVGEVQSARKVLDRRRKEVGTVDLRAAKVIVSAGRGVKRKEDLPMLDSLAQKLGGALGCSRPLSSDLGWLPEERHIGLTGVTVKPDLYIAVGISGQLQHIAGMKDSKVVVAINTDREAPIFQVSDFGIVGDLYQVVPAMERAVAGLGMSKSRL